MRHVIRTAAVVATIAGASLLAAVPDVATAQTQNLPDFRTLVKNNKDAVVNIRTVQTIERRRRGGFNAPDIPENHPFRDFFERFAPERGDAPPQRQAQSAGSGFILSADGTVLTNHHVIDGADEIFVRLANQQEYEAELIGSDEQSDVAVLKIDASNLSVAKLGDSNALEVGEWVLAIGSPFGLDYTATQGIVSALSRSLPGDNYVPFIQTDVAVNPGNSGGPLLNTRGEVVGINSQIFSRSGGYQGISFAIPVATAMRVVEQLQDQGYVSRGWLGVSIQGVSQDLASSFGLERPVGALVANVVPDSPADKAGILSGDIILEFNGRSVRNQAALPPIVGDTEVGSQARVLVLRDGRRKTVEVTIEELQVADAGRGADTPTTRPEMDVFGVAISDVTDDIRRSRDIPEGGALVTAVAPGSPAARAGIRTGDVILKFASTDVEGAKPLARLVADAPRGRPLSVLVQRGNNALFVAVTLEEDDE